MRRLEWLLSTLAPLRAKAECVAGETIHHSGTVIRHTVSVSPPTMFGVAQRPPSHTAWPGGFVEETGEAWRVKDFAAARCMRQGQSVTALEMVVTVADRP